MTWTYRCANCGKYFYFYGEVSRAFDMLIDANGLLSKNKFYVENIPSPWEVVQDKVRCCKFPDVSVVGPRGTLL